MAASSEQLMSDIRATRERMDSTLDEARDHLDPHRAWERREPRLRSKLQDMTNTVMGVADDTADRAGDGAIAVKDRFVQGTEGNPLAAGLVAFGAGLLAGSVLPSSRTERRAIAEVQQQVEEPVRQAVTESAREIRDRVGEQANQGMEQTQRSAAQAGQNVAGKASSAADHLRDEAASAAADVRRDVEGP
jgi:hypothetical protein